MSRRLRERPLVWAGFGLALVGLVVTVVHGAGTAQMRAALVFGTLIFIGELARVNLPGDREVSPSALAGALGYALLYKIGSTPTTSPVFLVVAVLGVAVGSAALLHGLA